VPHLLSRRAGLTSATMRSLNRVVAPLQNREGSEAIETLLYVPTERACHTLFRARTLQHACATAAYMIAIGDLLEQSPNSATFPFWRVASWTDTSPRNPGLHLALAT
jgi:hypothetical protein